MYLILPTIIMFILAITNIITINILSLALPPIMLILGAQFVIMLIWYISAICSSYENIQKLIDYYHKSTRIFKNIISYEEEKKSLELLYKNLYEDNLKNYERDLFTEFHKMDSNTYELFKNYPPIKYFDQISDILNRIKNTLENIHACYRKKIKYDTEFSSIYYSIWIPKFLIPLYLQKHSKCLDNYYNENVGEFDEKK